MPAFWLRRSFPPGRLSWREILATGGMVLPALLLLVGALRSGPHFNPMLWIGFGVQLFVCVLAFISSLRSGQSVRPSIVPLNVVGLGWFWLAVPSSRDWYPHLAQSILLVVPLVLFSWQILVESGAPTQRRAQMLASRLAQRQDWPEKLETCRDLPEVKALREAIQQDVSPALSLLGNPRPQVQVAALAALEFRKDWPRGQGQIVLNLAQRTTVPAVRAAAVNALGNVDDHVLIEGLAEFLRDPSWEVRRAAGEALLWDTEHRWPMIRQAVCHSLADPVCGADGPLHHEGQMLTAEAVNDLRAWTTQSGLLGQRAALTLAHHFARAMNECPSETLVHELHQQLANSQTPPVLRIELARLLKNNRAMGDSLLQELLDQGNPAFLRLLAAEALLARQPHHTQAVDTLHQLAKLPNRELALATADVVQRCLGFDLGLALGELLPSIFSRQAAEVIRRLLAWSTSEGFNSEWPGAKDGGRLASRPN